MEFKITHKDFTASISCDNIEQLIEHQDLSKSIPPSYINLLSKYEEDIFKTIKILPRCDPRSLILESILYTILYYNDNKDLYFFYSDTGLIKIGVSGDVDRRVTQVSRLVKSKLKIAKILKGCSQYEKSLHKIFSDINIPYMNQTEWFHPTTELISFIEKVDEKNITELCQTRLKKMIGRKKIS